MKFWLKNHEEWLVLRFQSGKSILIYFEFFVDLLSQLTFTRGIFTPCFTRVGAYVPYWYLIND